MNSLFFFFSDIFDSYFWWNRGSRIRDGTLFTSFEGLKKLGIEPKAENTVKKYSYTWNRWKNWANSKFAVKGIPAQPSMVAIYLRDLMEGSNSASVLDSTFLWYPVGS